MKNRKKSEKSLEQLFGSLERLLAGLDRKQDILSQRLDAAVDIVAKARKEWEICSKHVAAVRDRLRLLAYERQAQEESLSLERRRAAFADKWQTEGAKGRGVAEILSLKSWEIFPCLSDSFLTGDQRKALHRIFLLLLISRAYTVADLVRKYPQELEKYRGTGKKTVALVEEFLDRYGLSLGMSLGRIEADLPKPRSDFPDLEAFPGGLGEETAGQILLSLNIGKGDLFRVSCVDDLQLCSDYDLEKFRNMRPEWIEHIKKKMSELGIELRPY